VDFFTLVFHPVSAKMMRAEKREKGHQDHKVQVKVKNSLKSDSNPVSDRHCLQLCLGQSCVVGCTHFLRDSRQTE